MQNKFVSPSVTRTVTPVYRLLLSARSNANFHALTSHAVSPPQKKKPPLNLQEKIVLGMTGPHSLQLALYTSPQ